MKNGNRKHIRITRLVAAFLSFCLVMGSMPVTAYADTQVTENGNLQENTAAQPDASGDAPADVSATDGQELQSTQTDASGDSAAAAGEQSAQNTAGPARAARANAAESTEEGTTESTEGETTESTAGHQHTQNTQHTVCGSESADEHTYQKAVAEEDPDTSEMKVKYDNISISHNDIITWTAWGDKDDEMTSLPTDAGCYYLTADVTLSSTWTVNKEIYICLNGYSITGDSGADNKYLINVSKDGSLVLTDCNETSGRITNTRTSGYGGISVASGGKFEMYGGNITGNTSGKEKSGGGVCVSGGSFAMYGGEIAGNTASQNNSGGGVCVSGGSFAMYGGKIAENTANIWDCSGGGVYFSGGTFKMYGGEISKNTAPNGGGVYVNSAKAFYMYGGKISDNKAADSSGGGGGVYVYSAKTFDMYGGEISSNTSHNEGGGIYTKGEVRMFDGTISNNHADEQHGGGVYVDNTRNSKFTMYGGTISQNHSKYGGGVYSSTLASFTMKAGEISGNVATESGGGVFNENFLDLEGGTISKNTASTGGGVYINNNDTSRDSVVCGVTISGNTASGTSMYEGGGGIYNAGKGSLTISDAIISGNTAAESGGGVYNCNTLTISNTTISGNTAAERGGGVYNDSTLTISGDTTISDNKAASGGGVYQKDSKSKLTISGDIKVIDNTDNTKNKNANNVYLGTGDSYITIKNALGDDARIGISDAKDPVSVEGQMILIVKTDGYKLLEKDSQKFKSDNEDCSILFINDNIDLADHAHGWIYQNAPLEKDSYEETQKNVIIAYCKNSFKFKYCNFQLEGTTDTTDATDATDTTNVTVTYFHPTLTLSADNICYNGEPYDKYTIVDTGISFLTGAALTVTYKGREGTVYESTTPPTNPGKYTMTVTAEKKQKVKTDENTAGENIYTEMDAKATATADFKITIPVLKYIKLDGDPKKSYYYGEKFDMAGARVIGVYEEDGVESEVDVTNLAEYDDNLTVGQDSVIISCTDSNKKHEIKVSISVDYLYEKAVVSGTLGENGWYISDVTVSARDGYLIASDNLVTDLEWGKYLTTTVKEDGISRVAASGDATQVTVTENGTTVVHYALKDSKTGGLTANKTVTIQKDATAPTGTIAIENRDYKWDQPWSEPKTDEDASGDASDENQENSAKDLPEENTEGETDRSPEGSTEDAVAAAAQLLSYANSKNVAKAAALGGSALGGDAIGGGALGGGAIGGGTLGGGASDGSTVDPTGENKEESSQGDSNEASEDTTCKDIGASFMVVDISASDATSGIASVSYYMTPPGDPTPVEKLEEMKALKWEECKPDASGSSYTTGRIDGRWNDTQKEDKLILYVKITDVAGNETYLCTDVLKLSVKSPGSDDDTLDGDGNGNDGTGNKTGDGTGDDGTGETTPPFVPPLITPATDKPVIVPPADEPDELNPTIPGTVVTEPAEPDEPEEPSVPDEPGEPYEPERRLEPATLEKPDETVEPDAWDGERDPGGKQTGEPESAAANPDGVSITAADDNGGAVKVRQKDDEPQTGDQNRTVPLATMSMIAGLSYLMELFAERKGIRLRMTKTQKDQIIAHLIEWAKHKNGFIRRCTVVVIFGVLLYYYSVGAIIEEEDARTVKSQV